MTVVIDADALVGLVVTADPHYKIAARLAGELQSYKARVIMLPTTLAEFATVTSRLLGLSAAKEAVHTILKSYFFFDIDDNLSVSAIALYDKQTSNKNTLFDCYVMAAAKFTKADCIFSFDEGYKKNGFVLVKDILL